MLRAKGIIWRCRYSQVDRPSSSLVNPEVHQLDTAYPREGRPSEVSDYQELVVDDQYSLHLAPLPLSGLEYLAPYTLNMLYSGEDLPFPDFGILAAHLLDAFSSREHRWIEQVLFPTGTLWMIQRYLNFLQV